MAIGYRAILSATRIAPTLMATLLLPMFIRDYVAGIPAAVHSDGGHSRTSNILTNELPRLGIVRIGNE